MTATKHPRMVMEAKRWPGVERRPRGKNLDQRAAALRERAGAVAANEGPAHASWRVVARSYPPVPLDERTKQADRELLIATCAVVGGWLFFAMLLALPGALLLQGASQ